MAPKIRRVLKHKLVRFLLDLRPLGFGREYFETKEAAETRLIELENYGTSASKFGHAERLHYLEAKQKLEPFKETILGAVNFYIKHHSEIERRALEDGIREFLAVKESSGKRKRYVGQLRYTLNDLATKLGLSGFVESIQRTQIESWLDRPEWKASTRRSQFINAQTFFSFALDRKWTTQNPCEKIERIVLEDKPPGILTVDQCAALMSSAQKIQPGLLPYLTLALFCGIRPEEIFRLEWSEVDVGRGFVEIKAHKSKTRARRLVTLSENAKAWLKLGGDIPPTNWQDRLGYVRKDAGVPWSHDCLRHSFVSYALPIRGISQTAMDAGHSESILFQHYRELVTRAESEKFWSILPK